MCFTAADPETHIILTSVCVCVCARVCVCVCGRSLWQQKAHCLRRQRKREGGGRVERGRQRLQL